MMISKKHSKHVSIATISDVHLGHHKVPSEDIVRGLYAAFPDNDTTGELDIIFIAGDFFDRNIHLSHEGVGCIQLFISDLIKLCEKRDIILRILEGTPSHDWRQNALFINIAKMLKSSCNVRWIDKLYIEHIDALNMDVLYVPDEWEHDPNETWKQVQCLLSQHDLKQVDMGVMHGMFGFQLPNNIKLSHHDEFKYSDIVKHYITIGHVHVQRQWRNILAQGSFDRFCHGEEAAKGHYRLDISLADNGSDSIRFITNKLATKFITINCLGLSVAESLEVIQASVVKKPNGSHFRIIASAGSEIASAKRDIETMYPEFRWTMSRETVEDGQLASPFKLTQNFTPANINKETIKRLTLKFLADKHNGELDTEKLNRLEGLLNEVI